MVLVDTWVVVGAVAGLVVVVPVFVAAIFAVLAWRQGRETATKADERYERDVEPMPRVLQFDPDHATVVMANAGGAARQVIAVLRYGRDSSAIYITGGSLPAHCGSVTMKTRVFATTTPPTVDAISRPLILAAKDTQNRWWDCMIGQLITDWSAWWAEAAAAVGIPDIVSVESVGGRTVSFQQRPSTGPEDGAR
jgi:hypothetical protein